jgi:hypothetical protein
MWSKFSLLIPPSPWNEMVPIKPLKKIRCGHTSGCPYLSDKRQKERTVTFAKTALMLKYMYHKGHPGKQTLSVGNLAVTQPEVVMEKAGLIVTDLSVLFYIIRSYAVF